MKNTDNLYQKQNIDIAENNSFNVMDTINLHTNKEKEFWYNLGFEIGGPIYIGLYKFVLEELKKHGNKIYFLSRDGYNLYNLFKKLGHENIEYVYTSRRSLLLASITEMNEEEIKTLPPYTYGQTVGEILDFLRVDKNKIFHLKTAGFNDFEDVITDENKRNRFRDLYRLDKAVFLERCKAERDAAIDYFNKIGFFNEDSICFDCGWQGSSQDLLERFKTAVNSTVKNYFVYFGIKNNPKSCKQLKGKKYSAYRFGIDKNFALQYEAENNIVLYELFFSAPHESVFVYDKAGEVVFEAGEGDVSKAYIAEGIYDFIKSKIKTEDFSNMENNPEKSLENLRRLISYPTIEEATIIGNISNVDGFSKKTGEEKYIAFIDEKQIDHILPGEIYWLNGLLKRDDVSETVKSKAASKLGVEYPAKKHQYNVEQPHSIASYNRWARNNKDGADSITLDYQPLFSVVMPMKAGEDYAEESVTSILKQNYSNFELILIDENTEFDLQKYKEQKNVKIINGDYSNITDAVTGEFVVFVECGDIIEHNSLLEFAKKLNEDIEFDFIYSDEDMLTADGKFNHTPFFKPDWSPDLFASMNYTGHLSAYRNSVVKDIGGIENVLLGSCWYDFILRFTENIGSNRIGHIAKVLYHCRQDKKSELDKEYVTKCEKTAKQEYIIRNNINAHLEYVPGICQYRMVYKLEGTPLVSVIIPSTGNLSALMQCINSFKTNTEYPHYEIIVVDSCSKNKEFTETYLSSVNVKYIYSEGALNIPQKCNLGVSQSNGEFLLFLGAAVEIFQQQWLEKMIGHGQQKHVGAVGAKLLCRDSTVIQHFGIAVTDDIMDNFAGADDRYSHYHGINWLDYNVMATDIQCLLVDKEKFNSIGGFSCDHGAYSHIKLCADLYNAGYYNVMRSDVAMYSTHRQTENDKPCLYTEKIKLRTDIRMENGKDPFINENLRSYNNSINFKQCCEKVVEIDLSDAVAILSGNIDTVTYGENIEITGWSIAENQDLSTPPERYIVFKDPYGRTYGAKTDFCQRADVAKEFGIQTDMFIGFQCVLSENALGMNIVPYQIGIVDIDSNGSKQIKWFGQTAPRIMPQPLNTPAKVTKLNDNTLYITGAEVNWSLDACVRADDHFQLNGFAYIRGNNHYLYNKSIILTNEQNSYEVEVQCQERVDVACAFAGDKFILNSGFCCYLFDGSVSGTDRQEYNIVIRLKNQLDENDIIDIQTGKSMVI